MTPSTGYDTELLAVVFNLSPVQSDLLYLLLAYHYITSKQLASTVSDSAVSVYRLRDKLRKFGVAIENRRGRGYLIEAESRTIITQQLHKFQTQPVG
jgi:biotin operon repressor